MINQGAFAAITPIRPEKVASLQTFLEGMGENVDEPGCLIDFKKITSVHFMRWVVLDKAVDLDGNELAPCLLLSTNYDLPLDAHLKELIAVGGKRLQQIYENCVGFNGDLERYLRQHEAPYAAFYVGTRGRSVTDIHAEQKLRSAIQAFLDKKKYAAGTDPQTIHGEIQEYVRNDPALAWALKTDPIWRWYWFFFGPRYVMRGLGVVLLLVALAGIALGPRWLGVPWWAIPAIILGPVLGIVAMAGGLLLAIRIQEKSEENHPLSATPVGAPIEDLIQREDRIVQNQLSNVVLIKPSWLRRMTLKLVLAAVNFLGRYFFTRGALGGIPTIHFARWIIFDKGRRLLFLSNFDGSWENYLGDFIDKAAIGLTAIWSNAVGCPPARWLAWSGGARDEARFKPWTRENQLVTQVWYSAYDELSVENINNNSYVRVGLSNPMKGEKLREWLARL